MLFSAEFCRKYAHRERLRFPVSVFRRFRSVLLFLRFRRQVVKARESVALFFQINYGLQAQHYNEEVFGGHING